MINKFFYIILCSIIITSCGFKVSKKQKLWDFGIVEINTNGEKRINYSLKNKLNIYKNQSKEKLIKIHLTTKKTKNVKEKNIKNEITKYHVNITSKIEFDVVGKTKSGKFTVSRSGEYGVGSQHSQTLNNEKNLMRILIDNISDQILEEIVINLNDI